MKEKESGTCFSTLIKISTKGKKKVHQNPYAGVMWQERGLKSSPYPPRGTT